MVFIEAIWPRPWECATGWVFGSQTTFTDFSIIIIIIIIVIIIIIIIVIMAIFMMMAAVVVVVVMIMTIGVVGNSLKEERKGDYKTCFYKVYILLKRSCFV